MKPITVYLNDCASNIKYNDKNIYETNNKAPKIICVSKFKT